MTEVMGIFMEVTDIGENTGRPLRWDRAFMKRLFDILLSALGLVILSPVFAAAALAVKAGDGGPVLFRQERVTKDGRVFRILKLRSMRPAAYPGEPEEARVTRIGGFLRRHWLDELPQLVNVLLGDMSLVGPRPESLQDVARSKELCPAFSRREQVRAGLTGLAQLLGRYDTPPREKLALDMLYIEHYSLGLDALLILQTVVLVFVKKE